jgi:hypothetical protein
MIRIQPAPILVWWKCFNVEPTFVATKFANFGGGSNTFAYPNEFRVALHMATEYNPAFLSGIDGATQFVRGQFGALGNPSSFHNGFVRQMRLMATNEALKVFEHFLRAESAFRLEQCVDRMMSRPVGARFQGEGWHRDVPFKEAIGEIWKEHGTTYGGWINMSNHTQEFICVPGSQIGGPKFNNTSKGPYDPANPGEYFRGGFEVVKNNDAPLLTYLSQNKTTVSVPTGAMLIFNESILHKVSNVVNPHRVERLFIGWRLTTGTESIVDIMERHSKHPSMQQTHPTMLETLLHNQAVMRLKSGQWPRVYPGGVQGYYTQMSSHETWAHLAFRTQATKTPVAVNYKSIGGHHTWRLPHGLKKDSALSDAESSRMKSLQHMTILDSQIQMFDPYRTYEVDILRPSRKFRVLTAYEPVGPIDTHGKWAVHDMDDSSVVPGGEEDSD